MALSVFADKEKEPAFSDLHEVLGDSTRLLVAIEDHSKQEYGTRKGHCDLI